MEEEKQEDQIEEGTGPRYSDRQRQMQPSEHWDFILRQYTATRILVTLVYYAIVTIFKVDKNHVYTY